MVRFHPILFSDIHDRYSWSQAMKIQRLSFICDRKAWVRCSQSASSPSLRKQQPVHQSSSGVIHTASSCPPNVAQQCICERESEDSEFLSYLKLLSLSPVKHEVMNNVHKMCGYSQTYLKESVLPLVAMREHTVMRIWEDRWIRLTISMCTASFPLSFSHSVSLLPLWLLSHHPSDCLPLMRSFSGQRKRKGEKEHKLRSIWYISNWVLVSSPLLRSFPPPNIHTSCTHVHM